MSNLKISQIPCWLKNGNFFRDYLENNSDNDQIEIDDILMTYIRNNSKINNLEDFKRVYHLSSYWHLDRKPFDIWVYAFLNKKEIILYLEELSNLESKSDIEDIKKDKSLIKYKGIIMEDFNIPELNKFYNTLMVKEKDTKYSIYNSNYTAKIAEGEIYKKYFIHYTYEDLVKIKNGDLSLINKKQNKGGISGFLEDEKKKFEKEKIKYFKKHPENLVLNYEENISDNENYMEIRKKFFEELSEEEYSPSEGEESKSEKKERIKRNKLKKVKRDICYSNYNEYLEKAKLKKLYNLPFDSSKHEDDYFKDKYDDDDEDYYFRYFEKSKPIFIWDSLWTKYNLHDGSKEDNIGIYIYKHIKLEDHINDILYIINNFNLRGIIVFENTKFKYVDYFKLLKGLDYCAIYGFPEIKITLGSPSYTIIDIDAECG